jgi:hypothetical protein
MSFESGQKGEVDHDSVEQPGSLRIRYLSAVEELEGILGLPLCGGTFSHYRD